MEGPVEDGREEEWEVKRDRGKAGRRSRIGRATRGKRDNEEAKVRDIAQRGDERRKWRKKDVQGRRMSKIKDYSFLI